MNLTNIGKNIFIRIHYVLGIIGNFGADNEIDNSIMGNKQLLFINKIVCVLVFV